MKRGRSKKQKTFAGVVDTPLGDDALNIGPVVEGLATFIAETQTPMTLAVQGDWGTGKTNTMLRAERELAPHQHYRLSDPYDDPPEQPADPPIYTIRFNTWQYSQFDMGDKLIGSMLENIGSHLLLAKTDGETKLRGEFLASLVPIATSASLGVLHAAMMVVGGAAGGDVVDKISDAINTRRSKGETDVASALLEIRDAFQGAVKELVEYKVEVTNQYGEPSTEKRYGRVVVFIDDLDRLDPRKAVELMEALKLFLDVEHCVFVLAIDFEVVKRGVIAKYDLSSEEEGRARAFFEKIIQVPFQLPTSAYEIDSLIAALLGEVGIFVHRDDRKTFRDLIAASVGTNPRSIKRLINTFSLLLTIAKAKEKAAKTKGQREVSDIQLFAILCLQTAYPDAYENILDESIDDSELYQRYFNVSDESDDDPADGLEELFAALHIEANGRRFAGLADLIRGAFTVEGDFSRTTFAAAMTQAMATSAGGTERQGGYRQKHYGPAARRAHIAAEYPRMDLDVTLAGPERFAQRLEAIGSDVQVGAQQGDAKFWVIEVKGKRIGMIIVRTKRFFVNLEPKWIAEPEVDHYYRRFCESFPGYERRMKHNADGWFEVQDIPTDDNDEVDSLAEFWSEVASEVISRR